MSLLLIVFFNLPWCWGGAAEVNSVDTLRQHGRDSVALRHQQEIRQVLESHAALDTINGNYIPGNLEDVFAELNKLLPEEDIRRIREDVAQVYDLQAGLGTRLSRRWGLYRGSRLQKYFNERNVFTPEDMMVMVMGFYHNWLNDNHVEWKRFEKSKK